MRGAGSLPASYRFVTLPVCKSNTEEKFHLERDLMLSHITGAHTVVVPTALTVGERMPSPVVMSSLFLIDITELLEWDDLGPAVTEWMSGLASRRCHRPVLAYATGTTLWAELTVLNWQMKDIRVQPHSSLTALQPIARSNKMGTRRKRVTFSMLG